MLYSICKARSKAIVRPNKIALYNAVIIKI